MSEKKTFIEPYASIGGHMWGNVNFLQKSLHDEGVDYEFIVERDCDIPNYGFAQQFLMHRSELNKQAYVNRIQTRVREYANLFETRDSSLFIFLTNFTFEFDVWRILLKDSSWRKKILSEDRVIVVQITVLSLKFFDLLKQCAPELHELKRNLFFSFFSELQPVLVKKYTEYENCFTLFQAAHERFSYTVRPKNIQETYLSYLGFYNWEKNPHLMLDAFGQVNKEPFHIHFYPVTHNNSSLYSAFERKKRSDDFIDCRRLSADEYQEAIFRTKIGLLPYDSFTYSIRASGLLEEYLFAGVPVIVPEHSWLSFFLNRFAGGGVTFNPSQTGDFQKKIQQVVEQYDVHKKQALIAADRIACERSTQKYLSILACLFETRSCSGLGDLPDNDSSYKRAMDKGIAYHFSRFAQDELRAKNTDQAQQYIRKAREVDNSFWETDFLDALADDASPEKLFSIVHASMKKDREINVYSLLQKLMTYCVSKDDKESMLRMVDLIRQYNLCECLTLKYMYNAASWCERVGDYETAEVWFLKVSQCDDVRLKSGAFFHLGKIAIARENRALAQEFLESCLNFAPQHEKASVLLCDLANKNRRKLIDFIRKKH